MSGEGAKSFVEHRRSYNTPCDSKASFAVTAMPRRNGLTDEGRAVKLCLGHKTAEEVTKKTSNLTGHSFTRRGGHWIRTSGYLTVSAV